jgi:hypothetical protein
MWRLYKTSIRLTTGFFGSHTVTVYTLLQLTTVHYNTCRVFSVASLVACLPMPLGKFTFRANLQLFSEDCYFTHTLTGLDGALTLTETAPVTALTHTRRPTDWRSAASARFI